MPAFFNKRSGKVYPKVIFTDGEDDRGFCYHRLVEVGWCQCLLSFFTSCCDFIPTDS